MHIEFNVLHDSERESMFANLRASMIKLKVVKWAEQYLYKHDYSAYMHDNKLVVKFAHSRDYSIFALTWRDDRYTVVDSVEASA